MRPLFSQRQLIIVGRFISASPAFLCSPHKAQQRDKRNNRENAPKLNGCLIYFLRICSSVKVKQSDLLAADDYSIRAKVCVEKSEPEPRDQARTN